MQGCREGFPWPPTPFLWAGRDSAHVTSRARAGGDLAGLPRGPGPASWRCSADPCWQDTNLHIQLPCGLLHCSHKAGREKTVTS